MTIQEIIKNLRYMDNNNSSILPWQPSLICDAQELTNVTSNGNDILPFVKALNAVWVANNADLCSVCFFCFIPLSEKKWKVYVLNRFRQVLAQLENYEGEIQLGGAGFAYPFVLRLS